MDYEAHKGALDLCTDSFPERLAGVVAVVVLVVLKRCWAEANLSLTLSPLISAYKAVTSFRTARDFIAVAGLVDCLE